MTEERKETFEQFAKRAHIGIVSRRITPTKERAAEWKDLGASHWKVTLERFHDAEEQAAQASPLATFELEFSMGSAHVGEPSMEMVLQCLQSDSDVTNYRDFSDWARNLGYDEDSRKAEKIYLLCLTQADGMREFLAEFYDDFLNCVDEYEIRQANGGRYHDEFDE